jgi:radical SAM superfamily enzyme YgiQ (UPF0313 family)
MKICFINPFLATEGAHYMPLGIAYMAAVLRKEHDVSVIDFQSNPDMSIDADVVGITSISHNFTGAMRIAEAVKAENPDVTLVMGGPHVTFTDRDVLQNAAVDIVVRHEGEHTMRDLVRALDTGDISHVKGITYRKNGTIKRNPDRLLIKDLDSLSFPARDLFDGECYFTPESVVQIISGRGCPFRCMFCSASSMWGHTVRLRSPENVVDEIEDVLTRYNIRKFGFVDDTFTIVKKNTINICEEITRRGLDIEWGCNVRVDTLTEELVHTMRKAGCTNFFVGVESGNQKTLDFMHKCITVEQIERAVRLAQAHAIKVTVSAILGMPNETYKDVQKTIDFMISLKGDTYLFNFLLVYPGTELYERRKELGLQYVDDPWGKVEKTPFPIPTVETKHLTRYELSQLYLEAKAALEYLKEC